MDYHVFLIVHSHVYSKSATSGKHPILYRHLRFREKTIMKRKIIISSVFLLMALVFTAFKPISLSNGQKRVDGKIVVIYEGGVKDAVFKIDNSQTTFYLNRGFDQFSTVELNGLIGKTASFYYSDIWTPLDPFQSSSKNIEKLEVDRSIIFPR